jgi:hypothetical protein
MTPTIIKKKDLESEPWLIWNAYIDLLYSGKFEDLNSVQRPARLVCWYDGEVQNGGHLQYFENTGPRLLKEVLESLGPAHLETTIEALGILGASRQQQILREAVARLKRKPRSPIQSVEEFCETSSEGEFADLDKQLYQCTPSLPDYLQLYLDAHQSEFVTLI